MTSKYTWHKKKSQTRVLNSTVHTHICCKRKGVLSSGPLCSFNGKQVSTLFPSFVQFSREFKYPNSIIIKFFCWNYYCLNFTLPCTQSKFACYDASRLQNSRTPDSILCPNWCAFVHCGWGVTVSWLHKKRSVLLSFLSAQVQYPLGAFFLKTVQVTSACTPSFKVKGEAIDMFKLFITLFKKVLQVFAFFLCVHFVGLPACPWVG
jgi:hypothetical protein